MANVVEQLDAQVAALLSDWSLITTLIALLIVGFVAYPIIYPEEPDTHPLLLARQSIAAPIRNKNESAIYRSPEVPHGYPLKTGLNVKESGAPRWAAGKDGDLRDIWREVQKGGTTNADGKEVSKGLIMTVYGREDIDEHNVEQLSKEIQIMGQHLKASGQKRVAIYLSNSIEYLLTIFACSFYGLTPILLPYNLPYPKVYEILNQTGAGCLVSAAGSLPLDDVAKECPNLRLLTWVVEKTSRHMDWNGVPEGAEGRLDVSVWHDVVQEKQEKANTDLPSNETGDKPTEVVFLWPPKTPEEEAEIVTFTHANLVAGIAALVSALPLRQRFTAEDLVLPASSFSLNYVLCQTMAALCSHSSLAINSVAEPGVDLSLATQGIAPTVVVASAETMADFYVKEKARTPSLLQKLGEYSHIRAMGAGRLPISGLLFSLLAPSSATGNAPGKLRLILTSERLRADTPPLTSTMLSDLRMYTRSRICYALTDARVAGAIAQTNVYDYRRETGSGLSHFGVPLSSIEIKLTGSEDTKLGQSQPQGDVNVLGPAVSDGKSVNLGIMGTFREDGTLMLI